MAVRHPHRNAVSGNRSACGKRIREPVDPPVERRVVELRVAVEDSCPLTEHLRVVLEELREVQRSSQGTKRSMFDAS